METDAFAACRNTKSGKKHLRVPYTGRSFLPSAVKRSPERRRGSRKKARIGARHCSGRPRVNRKGWLTAPKQTQSSRRGTAAATPAAAATLFASRAGPRLEDLTKAMATGQMWTQAQPAERARRGAAAAERRLNGVAYTAPTLWHSAPDSGASRTPERRGDRLEPVPSTPQTQRHHADDTHSTETRQLLHAVQSAKASASSLESSLGSAATWSRAQNEVLLFAARARRTARSRRRRPKE